MAQNNQLATQGGRKSFTEISTILGNPQSRTKLQNYIDEAVRCKGRILDENESIKGLRDAAADELQLQPKMFNSLVTLYFNNNFEQKRSEIQELEFAIDVLLGMQGNDAGTDGE